MPDHHANDTIAALPEEPAAGTVPNPATDATDALDPIGPTVEPTPVDVGHSEPPVESVGDIIETLPTVSTPTVTKEQLVQRLVPVVQGTPGVARLVPTLKASLSRLRLRRSAGPRAAQPGGDAAGADTSGDGITVAIDGDIVTVVLDVSVSAGSSVLRTAVAVQSATTAALERSHPGRHTVTVNVLSLEPDTVTAPAERPHTSTPGPAQP